MKPTGQTSPLPANFRLIVGTTPVTTIGQAVGSATPATAGFQLSTSGASQAPPVAYRKRIRSQYVPTAPGALSDAEPPVNVSGPKDDAPQLPAVASQRLYS